MDKHNKVMKLAEASFEEISTSVEMGDPDDTESAHSIRLRAVVWAIKEA
jgi:hypothetical protein